MNFLKALVRFFDAVNDWVGYGISWVSSLMVAVVCYDVFTRYVLNKSLVAIQELEWHLFGLLFLIGAAYTLKENRHVRVDVIYSRLPPRTRALIDVFGHIVFLIPFCILVVWTSKNFVAFSFLSREGSPDPGGLPARYILKSAIPVGFSLLILQGVSDLLKSIMTLLGVEYSTGGSENE